MSRSRTECFTRIKWFNLPDELYGSGSDELFPVETAHQDDRLVDTVAGSRACVDPLATNWSRFSASEERERELANKLDALAGVL